MRARLRGVKTGRNEDLEKRWSESQTHDCPPNRGNPTQLRKLDLRPAALAAGLAEIEQERAELQAKADGKRDRKWQRARQLLAHIPELADRYKKLMQSAIKVFSNEECVHDAREALRRLLVDGQIVLRPNGDGTAVTGPVHLKGLGEHLLEVTGFQRHTRKLSGSGGRI